MTVLLWLVLAFVQVAPAQPSTCEIRGRVTDRETGAPIARAAIRLSSTTDDAFAIRALTDDDGRYSFEGLVPGTYRGWVEPGEFRATHLPAPLGPFRGIAVRGGEVREVDIALSPTRAISVRVVDEAGEPLARVSVDVKDVHSGRRRDARMFRTTDDRGHLRMFGLQRGRYIVCAEASGLAVSHTAGASRRERFLRTCHPSAATEAEATPVRLEESDAEGIEIRMRRGRSFTVSGMLLDSSGNPALGGMIFLTLTRFESNGSSSTAVRVEDGGLFTITNLEPGDYALEASSGRGVRAADRGEPESAFVPVQVDTSDVSGLVVQMQSAVDVAGRVVLDDDTASIPARPGWAPMLVQARLAGDRLAGTGSTRGGHVGDDRVFHLDRMFGRRTIEVFNVPPGWHVKSIRYEGKDITDVPVAFKGSRDPSALQIVLSKHGATVAGRVFDERGEAVRGARVLLFSASPDRWGTREPDSVFASRTGEYRTGPQRPGDYLIVALGPGVPPPEYGDRERIARLAEAAERITLTGDEQRTFDVRVLSGRDR